MSFTIQQAREQDKYSQSIWERMTPKQRMIGSRSASPEEASNRFEKFNSADKFGCIVTFQHLISVGEP